MAQGSWYIKLTITQFCLSLPSFFFSSPIIFMSFPDSSVSKQSTCNAGDPSLIPGSGRSAGEGIGYPLKYSWASLVAQLVKNPPAMQETWVLSLGWESPLEKGKATHSSILAWRIPWCHKDSDMTERLKLSLFTFKPKLNTLWEFLWKFTKGIEVKKGHEAWTSINDSKQRNLSYTYSLSFFFAFSICWLSFIPILSTCLSF